MFVNFRFALFTPPLGDFQKASRANGEANRVAGAAWKRLEGAGHGGRGSSGDGGRWRGVLEAKSDELGLGPDLRARGEVWPRLGAAL
jgi:hypothetical protein